MAVTLTVLSLTRDMDPKALARLNRVLSVLAHPDHIEFFATASGIEKVIRQWNNIVSHAGISHFGKDELFEYVEDLFERSQQCDLDGDVNEQQLDLLYDLAREVYSLKLSVEGDKLQMNHINDHYYHWIPSGARRSVKPWTELNKLLPDWQQDLTSYEVRHNCDEFEVVYTQEDLDEALEMRGENDESSSEESPLDGERASGTVCERKRVVADRWNERTG